MKFFILGIVLIIAGIPLMNVNFYLGITAMGIGALTASWFKGQAMKSIFNKAVKKQSKSSEQS